MECARVCRVCGSSSPVEEATEDFSNVAGIYHTLTSSRGKDLDLPDIICRCCYAKLVEIERFRILCLEALERLRETVQLIVSEERDIKQEEKAEVEFLELQPGEEIGFVPEPLPVKVETTDGDSLLDTECLSECETEKIDDSSTDESEADRKGQSVRLRKQKRKQKEITNVATRKTKIECDQCDKFFWKQKRYEGHLRAHEGLKPAVCEICDKSFSKWTYLKQHRQTVHAPVEAKERIPCEVPGCEKTFAMKHHLKFHLTKKHTGSGLNPKWRHMCEQCGKTFTTVANLRIHKYSHGGKMPFACNLCGRRMESNFKLKIHMMRHKGIKEHSCPICGMKKTTITELKTHMNTHTREKKYPCETCGMVFYSIGNKQRHVRIVHQGVKAYSCTFCEQSFGKAETLKHHVMTHTGEKPHVCDLCGKRFIQPTALQTHKRTHFKNLGNVSQSS
ncbi:gastrula zinc finger protein XlCGF46.1-like [Wyeomyia smithii]|uniref:gastrula zinc finger protein XlCGF46.1-like n=1 Tax=Wyeomyia smithii TaxID=174621 RepID=UPI002467C83B|nr:gastrula zinc finger protein XlCGF46.1-like [Wyeomyia smithii]